ncbi:helix-turn-helix domain-containing protein [Cellulomonas sp. APG4]|uniref:helix-turn-helix domain-containing protein n=1 Tax=Cellulomonas sp. APG4 TaxID=1538656 RepID=UPI00137B62B9|nr:helix-turn-helix domain-containing protein [Cellulomonas sp. APG4]NCT91997.1 helix-turn-helix domain-containing protein [Cellulomonas sp. APG4]
MSTSSFAQRPARPLAPRALAGAPVDTRTVENPDPLLTKAELAGYLNISERAARTLVEERRLDVVVIGRSLRVRRSTADRYIAACTQVASRPAATDSYGRDVWLPRAA